MLNEKALEAAKKAVKASAIYNPAGDVSSLARPALEAYFRSLPSSPVSELVERLRYCAAKVHHDPATKAMTEAAARITALEAENARLRAQRDDFKDEWQAELEKRMEVQARLRAANAHRRKVLAENERLLHAFIEKNRILSALEA